MVLHNFPIKPKIKENMKSYSYAEPSPDTVPRHRPQTVPRHFLGKYAEKYLNEKIQSISLNSIIPTVLRCRVVSLKREKWF